MPRTVVGFGRLVVVLAGAQGSIRRIAKVEFCETVHLRTQPDSAALFRDEASEKCSLTSSTTTVCKFVFAASPNALLVVLIVPMTPAVPLPNVTAPALFSRLLSQRPLRDRIVTVSKQRCQTVTYVIARRGTNQAVAPDTVPVVPFIPSPNVTAPTLSVDASRSHSELRTM